MDELKATPVKHDWAMKVANALRSARDFADKAVIPEGVPLLGGTPMGEMLMGQTPEGFERIAYGEPLTTGKGWTTKPRQEAVDMMFSAMDAFPVAKAATKVGAKGAEAASSAALRRMTGNPNATPARVIDEITQMNPMAAMAATPKDTVKAYKLFRTKNDDPSKLYPLFVNADKEVPLGEWIDAEVGPITEAGKVKSKLGPLAYRPGWHAGDMPVATHIGGKSDPALKGPDFRPANQVWAEVEMPNDVDWQKIAMERAERNKAGEIIPRTAHITDQLPEGGHYRYKTNPNMTGDWMIGGSMKVNRVLPPEEVMAINEAAGVADLPPFTPLSNALRRK